jgi:hypothetical protein
MGVLVEYGFVSKTSPKFAQNLYSISTPTSATWRSLMYTHGQIIISENEITLATPATLNMRVLVTRGEFSQKKWTEHSSPLRRGKFNINSLQSLDIRLV